MFARCADIFNVQEPAALINTHIPVSSADTIEEKLLKQTTITPKDVLQLKRATKGYLCSNSENKYGIDFLSFCLRDMDSKTILFEVSKRRCATVPHHTETATPQTNRYIQYQFDSNILNLRNIGASIEFSVGKHAIKDFLMIERHYFREKLLKSFEFNFGFVVPESVNSVEHIYDLPKLSTAEIKDIIANPYETKSDSFYFVEGCLIMHNKAAYSFTN